MSEDGKKREIYLGEDFGLLVVKRGGIKVVFNGDDDVDVFTNGAVRGHRAVDDSVVCRPMPQVGDEMEDGTVYAGISPDTGMAMYATPPDATLTMKWEAAMEYAGKLDAHSRQDWRVPTKGELNVLFQNRAAIGGFNETGAHDDGWYWSSSYFWNSAWIQRFSNGGQHNTTLNYYNTYQYAALRCVRE
jgi:hypothetical protein